MWRDVVLDPGQLTDSSIGCLDGGIVMMAAQHSMNCQLRCRNITTRPHNSYLKQLSAIICFSRPMVCGTRDE